jgi:thioredoxin 1
VVREVAAHLAGKAAVVQVNTDQNQRLSQQFSISGIPAMLLFRQGNVIDRMGGAASREAIVSWVHRHLGGH